MKKTARPDPHVPGESPDERKLKRVETRRETLFIALRALTQADEALATLTEPVMVHVMKEALNKIDNPFDSDEAVASVEDVPPKSRLVAWFHRNIPTVDLRDLLKLIRLPLKRQHAVALTEERILKDRIAQHASREIC